jgi:class 3 adenylate cyclase
VLASQEVVDAADLDGVVFSAIGPIELKGVSQPLTLHSVHRAA